MQFTDTRSRFNRTDDADMDFGGIFDSNSINMQTPEDEVGGSTDPDIYAPNHRHKKCVNGTYSARLRIVPNVNDKDMTRYSKFMYYLKDASENAFYVDCTSNWGVKNNIITAAFFYLKDSEDILLKALSKQFSRKLYSFSLVQIMKDPQEEELQNTVKIFRYPSHNKSPLNKMIEALDKGDASMNIAPVKVVDLFKGRDLLLKLNEKTYDDNGTTKKMTSYEDSTFDGISTSISLDGGITRVPMPTGDKVKDREVMQTIFNYLKEKSPSMDKVKAQPWDDELQQRIMDTVRASINDDKIYNIILGKSQKGSKNYGANNNKQSASGNLPAQPAAQPAQNTASSTENIAGDLHRKKDELAANLTQPEQPAVVAQAEPAPQAAVAELAPQFDELNSGNGNSGSDINFDEL